MQKDGTEICSVHRVFHRNKKKAAYKKDPDKYQVRIRRWQSENKARCIANAIAWQKANPEKFREIQKRADAKRKPQKKLYRLANAEKIKANNAEYRLRTIEKRHEYNSEYYEQNRDAVNARIKKCVAKRPEHYRQLHRSVSHRRKARLLGREVEVFQNIEIFKRDNWTCHICGHPVDKTLKYPDLMSASLDHVDPVAKTGNHTRDNCKCAHLKCNLIKKDREMHLVHAVIRRRGAVSGRDIKRAEMAVAQ